MLDKSIKISNKEQAKKPKLEYKFYDHPEKLALLETVFKMGSTDEEACALADITMNQLYYYQRVVNKEYADQKALWKNRPIVTSRKNIIEALSKKEIPLVVNGQLITDSNGNPIMIEDKEDKRARIDTSKWYLERKKKDEFSLRIENTGKDGKDLNLKDDPRILKTLLEVSQSLLDSSKKMKDDE